MTRATRGWQAFGSGLLGCLALACSGSGLTMVDDDAGDGGAPEGDAASDATTSIIATDAGAESAPSDGAMIPDAPDSTAADGAASDSSTEGGDAGSGSDTGAGSDAGADSGTDGGTATNKRVFVSSATYSGFLGGLNGADSKCQGLATAAGLSGTYKAWLSDRISSPSTRMLHAFVPYVRTDGATIATSWFGLTSGLLLVGITLDEKNVPVFAANVWTNTKSDGTASSTTSDCTFWASTAGTVVVGSTGGIGAEWTVKAPAQSCGAFNRIYCVEQ